MKNIIIIVLLVFSASVMANVPFNTEATPDVLNKTFWAQPQEYTFSAGDTTTTFSFVNARVCKFTIRDSSMSGTDSIYIALKNVYNGITFYSTVTLSAATQTTTTTVISSALVQPTDGLTVGYWWYPCGKLNGCDIAWTGTFYVARLNQPPTAAGYQPKTRIIFEYY